VATGRRRALEDAAEAHRELEQRKKRSTVFIV